MTRPQDLVEAGLSASRSRACVVLARHESVVNLRWARSTLTTNGETTGLSLGVVAIVEVDGGLAAGSVTANSVSLEQVPDLVRAAEEAARREGPADDAAELAAGIDASADWADEPARSTSADLAVLAPRLGETFAAATADGIELFGYAELSTPTVYLGTSSGTRLRFAEPTSRLEQTAKSHGRSRSAWTGRSGTRFLGTELDAMDAELRRGLAWQAHRLDVEPGRHPALLTPSAVADLMIDLYWSSAARDAAQGQSVWSAPDGTRLSEQVADPRVTLLSDPRWPGLETVPFVTATASSAYFSVFDNGLPLGPVRWIDRGALTGLVSTRRTAAEAGLPHQPMVDNLVLEVEGGAGSLEDVIARTDDALLVTCLWYNRVVDPQTLLLTGLTRDGVYVVRGGEVVGAASNFRFNDSPVDLLRRVQDAGDPEPTLAREMADYFPRAVMPPIVVRDYNFSTVSQAS